MSTKNISSTSKNMTAPFPFFSNTSTNQKASPLKQNNTFPGSLNYTNLTDYQVGSTLGQGAYAVVKQATHKQSGMVVAIKIYDKYKLQ